MYCYSVIQCAVILLYGPFHIVIGYCSVCLCVSDKSLSTLSLIIVMIML